MLDKKKYSFYLYGITNVKENDRSGVFGPNASPEDIKRTTNPNLLIVEYGGGKNFFVKKVDAYDFVKAIVGENFLKEYDIDEKKFYEVINKAGYVNALNELLLGSGIIFVTEFKSYFEYSNGGQNRVVGVTGIDLDGEYIAKNESELFGDNVSYNDIYKYDAALINKRENDDQEGDNGDIEAE